MEVGYLQHLLAVESQVAAVTQDCPLVQAPSMFITGTIVPNKLRLVEKKKNELNKTLN